MSKCFLNYLQHPHINHSMYARHWTRSWEYKDVRPCPCQEAIFYFYGDVGKVICLYDCGFSICNSFNFDASISTGILWAHDYMKNSFGLPRRRSYLNIMCSQEMGHSCQGPMEGHHFWSLRWMWQTSAEVGFGCPKPCSFWLHHVWPPNDHWGCVSLTFPGKAKSEEVWQLCVQRRRQDSKTMLFTQWPYWQVGGELWEFFGSGFRWASWEGLGKYLGRGKEWVRDLPKQALLSHCFNRDSTQRVPVPVSWDARRDLLRSQRAASPSRPRLWARPSLWGRSIKPILEKFSDNQRISCVWKTSRENPKRSLSAAVTWIPLRLSVGDTQR